MRTSSRRLTSDISNAALGFEHQKHPSVFAQDVVRGERNLKRASKEDQGDGGSKSRRLVPTETDSDGEGQQALSVWRSP